MTTLPYRQTGPLVPASPFRSGDPPRKQAELTILSLGPNQDAIVPCLELLGEFSRRELQRFQTAMPVTIPLPAAYYDKSNAFVQRLMATGTRFRIRFWSWVCPDEMRDEHHWCTGICPVMEITEVIEA